MSNSNSPKNLFGTIPLSRSFAAMAVSAIALPLCLMLALRLLVYYPLNQLGDDAAVASLILPNNQSAIDSTDLIKSEDVVIREVSIAVPDETKNNNVVSPSPARIDGDVDRPKAADSRNVDSGDKVELEMANKNSNDDKKDSGSAGDVVGTGSVAEVSDMNSVTSLPVVSEGDGGGTGSGAEVLDSSVSAAPVASAGDGGGSGSGAEVLDKNSVASSPVVSAGDGREIVSAAKVFDNNSVPSSLIVTVGDGDGAGTKAVDSRSCNLYQGRWIYDYMGPLYTNNSCPTITPMQNCQGNGRPDKDYENWRWKPEHCELPRFDGKKFLELLRGKTLAFIGDSVARNQMESLICMLWQVETPRNRGNRRMQRWYFHSTSTTIVRIWSSWLVHKTSQPFQSIPEEVVKVFLDLPDEDFMEFLPRFDVVVLSSGHWFAKQSAYILNDTIVGGQLWWPKDAGTMKVNNIDAFGISVETCLTAIASHPNFSGLAIVRSYSPDHYEGGAWNTGGSCTGKESPVTELVRNEFTDVMHMKQVNGFEKAKKAAGKNGSKMILMDITEAYGYRPDGHPGPYRSQDPNKITKRGPNGEPPPQDCLHWCMPGPIDTWNEFLLETIRRDFERA